MSRFVRPDTVTLTLTHGDTITVKKRLTSGEQRAAFARMYLAADSGLLQRHPVLYGINMVCAYLIDWSLKGLDGQVMPIRGLSTAQLVSVLDNLSPEDFREIETAIDQHEDRMAAERAEAKKTQDGETASKATSGLPSDAAGGSTGSETSTLTITACS